MKTFTPLARIEWVLLIAFSFPIQVASPVVCYFTQACILSDALVDSAFGALFLAALTSILAMLVDSVRGQLSKPAAILSHDIQANLTHCLSHVHIGIPAPVLMRTRVLRTDLALGAHTRGIFRPYLVISGGLLVGLLRKDPRASAILCHELAHLDHFDRLLPGLMGLIFFQVVGTAVKTVSQMVAEGQTGTDDVLRFLFLAVYNAIVLSFVLSSVSKYREFYADAKAVSIFGDQIAYVDLLNSASGRETRKLSFFHPTLAKRVAQVTNGFPVLRRAVFWRIFWPLNLIISWYQWWMSRLYAFGDAHFEQYTESVILVSACCIAFEFVRGSLAPPKRTQR